MNPIPVIAERLWQEAGRPEGQDQRFWLQAEQVVMAWAMRRFVQAILSAEADGREFPAPSTGDMTRRAGVADELVAAVLGSI